MDQPDKIIKLNVGGTIFQTTKSTLTKIQYFNALLNESYTPLRDDNSNIFIDYDPTEFKLVLNFLRTSNLDFNINDINIKNTFLYFGIDIGEIVSNIYNIYQIKSVKTILVDPQELRTDEHNYIQNMSINYAHNGQYYPVFINNENGIKINDYILRDYIKSLTTIAEKIKIFSVDNDIKYTCRVILVKNLIMKKYYLIYQVDVSFVFDELDDLKDETDNIINYDSYHLFTTLDNQDKVIINLFIIKDKTISHYIYDHQLSKNFTFNGFVYCKQSDLVILDKATDYETFDHMIIYNWVSFMIRKNKIYCYNIYDNDNINYLNPIHVLTMVSDFIQYENLVISDNNISYIDTNGDFSLVSIGDVSLLELDNVDTITKFDTSTQQHYNYDIGNIIIKYFIHMKSLNTIIVNHKHNKYYIEYEL